MKKILFLPGIAMVALLLVQCKESNAEEIAANTTPVPARADLVERGEYLVTTMGCADCHSPKMMTPNGPAPDPDRWLMGHDASVELPAIIKEAVGPGKWVLFNLDQTAAVGPWGVSFAANLTPHETGLKYWTIDNFKLALKEGRFKGMKGSRPLLPPMPWQNYKDLTDSDMEAMFLYLKSIEPIDNVVPNAMSPEELK